MKKKKIGWTLFINQLICKNKKIDFFLHRERILQTFCVYTRHPQSIVEARVTICTWWVWRRFTLKIRLFLFFIVSLSFYYNYLINLINIRCDIYTHVRISLSVRTRVRLYLFDIKVKDTSDNTKLLLLLLFYYFFQQTKISKVVQESSNIIYFLTKAPFWSCPWALLLRSLSLLLLCIFIFSFVFFF